MCGGVNNDRPVARPPVAPERPVQPNGADYVNNNCRVDRPVSPERPRPAVALHTCDVFEGSNTRAPLKKKKLKKQLKFMQKLARLFTKGENLFPGLARIGDWLRSLIAEMREKNTPQLPR